jgi:hypothetical protein
MNVYDYEDLWLIGSLSGHMYDTTGLSISHYTLPHASKEDVVKDSWVLRQSRVAFRQSHQVMPCESR